MDGDGDGEMNEWVPRVRTIWTVSMENSDKYWSIHVLTENNGN